MTAPTYAPPQDVNDILMGNDDGPSAAYLKLGPANNGNPQKSAPGEVKGGKIVALRAVPAYRLGKPDAQGKRPKEYMTYQSGAKQGQTIWDVMVTLQTDERDPAIEGDDGLRRVQLDGFDKTWEQHADFDCRKRAVRLAVAKAGKDRIEIGGHLYLTWLAQVPSAGGIPATHWAARYEPPNASFQFEQARPAAGEMHTGTIPAPVAQQLTGQYGQQGPGVVIPPAQPAVANPFADGAAPMPAPAAPAVAQPVQDREPPF
jgi:hypothetical protein